MNDEVNAGRARLAANIIVDVWRVMGSPLEDYDLVWRAKEYLHDKADTFEAGSVTIRQFP